MKFENPDEKLVVAAHCPAPYPLEAGLDCKPHVYHPKRIFEEDRMSSTDRCDHKEKAVSPGNKHSL